MNWNGAPFAAPRLDQDVVVSVVVCNYNYGRYLEEAVESLAQQTHSPIELLLVDDGSTDASATLMARLARRFRSRFTAVRTLLRTENAGQLACLNASLHHLHGDLVVVFDSDDVLDQTFLEQSIDALREHRPRDSSLAVVYSDCEFIDHEGRALGIGRAMPWDSDLLERCSYIPGCALTLTSALRAAAPFDESIRIATKHHRWIRLNQAGGTALHLPRPLFSYRLHEGNNSGIGARLLPDLDGRRGTERLFAEVWPTVTAGA